MRNPDGRFAAGNPGGPGRPRRDVEREYLSAIVGAVSIEDLVEIVKKAVSQAKGGDDKARAWLSRALGVDGVLKVCRVDDEGDPIAEAAEQEAVAEARAEEDRRFLEAFKVLRSLGLANERMLTGRDADADEDDEEEFALN